MSTGLYASLGMATRSLHAQEYGLSVTGQNIANANTPGYARRVTDHYAVPEGAGGGVSAADARAIRDDLLEQRLRREVPQATKQAALAESLAVVETGMVASGASLDSALSGFLDAFSSLAAEPTSAVHRRDAQLEASGLAAAFGDAATRFESARQSADAQVRATVEEINSLASRIASLNDAIGSSANGSNLALQDQQADLVRQLTELADVNVLPRGGGGVDISIGSGRPLVVNENAYALELDSVPPSGYADVTSGIYTITGEIGGGRLGGLLQARDTTVPAYQDALDTLAWETAQQVNALHTAGFDLQGVAGTALFTFTPALGAPPAGAASAIGVNPAIEADPSLIAAAGVALPGDNQVAQAIADLRTSRVLDGGTATLFDGYANLVYAVGRDSQAASAKGQSLGDVVRQVDALRDQVSGVSLDEEALNMLKFQRAYEANARFFRAVDQTLSMLFQALGS